MKTMAPCMALMQTVMFGLLCGLAACGTTALHQSSPAVDPRSCRRSLGFLAPCSPARMLRVVGSGFEGKSICLDRTSLVAPRADRRNGILGSTAVLPDYFKAVTKQVADSVVSAVQSQMRKGPVDVEALRSSLGEQEFDSVKQTIGKMMAEAREEKRKAERQALEEQKKLRKELNEYSNKVRQLEFQLILAATEVTELEEKISYYEYDEDSEEGKKPRKLVVNPEQHPVFGTLIADFGYKKIYSADPAKLYAKTPIYKKQRTFRTERASAMARAKASSSVVGWPGTITVVELGDKKDGETEFVLVDGQHRLGAFTLLAKEIQMKNSGGPLPAGMTEILVEVYPKASDEQAAEIFTEINKAEPCKLIDIPQSGASADEKLIIDTAAENLRKLYSDMFKPSEKCRTPHMNVDNLRDELFQSGIVKRKGFKNGDELLQWMLKMNENLAAIPDEKWAPKHRTRAASLEKALVKARGADFFLGLEWDWLNDNFAN